MSLFEPLRPHARTLSISAVILCLGLGGAVLHGYASLQSQNRQLDQLGQTLARSAAQRAVDATLSQDMLSLRASLQDLTDHPQVIGATIHDVENQLLVQSGFSADRFQSSEYRRYSAPVALDDKVAGHLQLVLKPVRLSPWDWRFFWLWGLMAVTATLFPWWRHWLKRRARSNMNPRQRQAPPAQMEAEEPSEAPGHERLRLRLQLVNLAALFNQLNRESFERQLRLFERQLKGVIALYGGHHQALSVDTLLIDFEGEQRSDCAFRALCSAQLLDELSRLNPGPRLRLAARVHGQPESDAQALNLSELFIKQYQPEPSRPAQGIAILPELIDNELLQHLELDPETGSLLSIKAPYRQLLDRQQQQLQLLA